MANTDYLGLIIAISVYFLFISIALTSMQSDPLITGAYDGNTSTSIDVSGGVNMSVGANTAQTSTAPKSYFDMVGRMFSFRLSGAGIPEWWSVIIGWINWALLIILGACIYRMVNPFGG